jgi:hypothetical protein
MFSATTSGSSLAAPNKAFKNPFYSDTKASCYVYADKHTKIFKIKDFGDPEFSGDCFFLVGKDQKSFPATTSMTSLPF